MGAGTPVTFGLALAGDYWIAVAPADGSWLKPLVSLLSAVGAGVLWWAWVRRRQAGYRQVAECAGLASASPLVLSRRAARLVRRNEFTGRVGPDAARHLDQVANGLYLNRILFLVVMLMALASVNLYGTWVNYAYVALLPAMALVAVASLVLRGWITRQSAEVNRSAAEALGRDLAQLLRMPGPQVEYETWCAASGLAPYPFGRPDWTSGQGLAGEAR